MKKIPMLQLCSFAGRKSTAKEGTHARKLGPKARFVSSRRSTAEENGGR